MRKPRGRVVVTALLAVILLVAAGCGESESSEPEAADTSLAAEEFESTFNEPPEACEAGYGDWNGDDVTYCYSGEIFAGKPFNTGCYITETGQDVTVAYRNANGTDFC